MSKYLRVTEVDKQYLKEFGEFIRQFEAQPTEDPAVFEVTQYVAYETSALRAVFGRSTK